MTSILNPKKTPVAEDLIGNTYVYTAERGWKLYELTNHLGNVLVTVTDKKIGVPSSGNSSLIDHYNADVVSASDYYPFGMLMPGRKFESGEYRYGFNGKENDDEGKGEGNSVDFGNRIYDSRIGKWLSVDPLQKKYPDLSPYSFSGNSPIVFGDYDGEDFGIIYDTKSKTIYVVGFIYVRKEEKEQVQRAIDLWNAKSAVSSNGYTITFQLKTRVPELQSKEEFKSSQQ